MTPALPPETPSPDSLGWGAPGCSLQRQLCSTQSYWSKQWDTHKETVGKETPQGDTRASKEPPCFHSLPVNVISNTSEQRSKEKICPMLLFAPLSLNQLRSIFAPDSMARVWDTSAHKGGGKVSLLGWQVLFLRKCHQKGHCRKNCIKQMLLFPKEPNSSAISCGTLNPTDEPFQQGRVNSAPRNETWGTGRIRGSPPANTHPKSCLGNTK